MHFSSIISVGDTQGFGLDERRDMSIGKKIATRRKELGLTQEMLAEKLSLSAQAVSRWENEWNLPDMDNLSRIAEILGMSVSNLIGGLTNGKSATSFSPRSTCLRDLRQLPKSRD